MKLSILPAFMVADYCIRCCRNFLHKEPTVMVLGGPGARHRDLAVTICDPCLIRKDGIDNPVAEGLYNLHKRGVDGIGWPEYVNTGKRIWGFVHVARLACPDGKEAYRVGLERGYPLIWTKRQVEAIGAISKPGVLAWTADYKKYGEVSDDPAVFVNIETEVRFYALRDPGKYFQPAMSAETVGEPS
jgi:hypothetical protein